MKRLEDFSSDELERLIARLTLHAHQKMKRLTWRGGCLTRAGGAAGGVGPEDLAQQAVMAVLNPCPEQGRSWNPETHPDLEQYLVGTIDSLVSNLVSRADNRKERRPATTPDGEEIVIEISNDGCEPVKLLIDTEAARTFLEEATKALGDDEEAVEVLELLHADMSKPQEIADYLGIPVADVNNIKKRILRKLQKCERLMALYRQRGTL